MMNKKDRNEYFIKYRKSNLTQLSSAIQKDLADQLRSKLAQDGISFSQFLKNAIKQYLDGE